MTTVKYLNDLVEKFSCDGAQSGWIASLISELLNSTNEILGLDVFSGPESKEIVISAARVLYEYFSQWYSELKLPSHLLTNTDKGLYKLLKLSEGS